MSRHLLLGDRRVAYYFSPITTPPHGAEAVPLVLLHGFCEDASVWDDFVPLLPDIPIIRVDLPGFGDSEVAAQSGLEGYAEAVKAVLDQENLARCVLIGHSMGGYAGLAFAEKWPERLAGLGLFHSHAWPDGEEAREKRRRGIEMLEGGKKDLYVAQLFPGLFAPGFADKHPEVLEKLIECGRRQSIEGIIAALQVMLNRPERTHVLAHLACPALFILGEKDLLAPPERALEATPDQADIHVLPGVGHMGMFEAREATARMVKGFWEDVIRKSN